ncbi:MAG: hypothetical protein WA866_28460, partial [Pseudolabrys sp.]
MDATLFSHFCNGFERRELLAGDEFDGQPLPGDFSPETTDRHPPGRESDLDGFRKPQLGIRPKIRDREGCLHADALRLHPA